MEYNGYKYVLRRRHAGKTHVKTLVYKNKVVYIDKAIPVKGDEIVKHHYVYVPFPTDDGELLKKGPFSAPNYENKDDKDKKK